MRNFCRASESLHANVITPPNLVFVLVVIVKFLVWIIRTIVLFYLVVIIGFYWHFVRMKAGQFIKLMLYRFFFMAFWTMLTYTCSHLRTFLAPSVLCANFFAPSMVSIRLLCNLSMRWSHGSKKIIILQLTRLKLFGFAGKVPVSSLMGCMLMIFSITPMIPTCIRFFNKNLLNVLKLSLGKLQYILAIKSQWIPTN